MTTRKIRPKKKRPVVKKRRPKKKVAKKRAFKLELEYVPNIVFPTTEWGQAVTREIAFLRHDMRALEWSLGIAREMVADLHKCRFDRERSA